MTLLLNSFSFVPLLVRICAEMDDTSFEVIQSTGVMDLSPVGDACVSLCAFKWFRQQVG